MIEWNTTRERTAAATALLGAEGGDGAALRGHVPPRPRGAVLLLHGGAESGGSVVTWWALAVLRMVPFALAITRRSRTELAVLRLKYRVRGWNGGQEDPVRDARWALDRIRRSLPGRPIVLVGHSMGGRVALHLAGEPDVVAVAALAPWVAGTLPAPRPGTKVLLVHGTADRVTDPRRTRALAERLGSAGVDVRHVSVEGGDHPMLRDAARWHDTVAAFVTDAVPGPARTS